MAKVSDDSKYIDAVELIDVKLSSSENTVEIRKTSVENGDVVNVGDHRNRSIVPE